VRTRRDDPKTGAPQLPFHARVVIELKLNLDFARSGHDRSIANNRETPSNKAIADSRCAD
jgi:hypothetical protein